MDQAQRPQHRQVGRDRRPRGATVLVLLAANLSWLGLLALAVLVATYQLVIWHICTEPQRWESWRRGLLTGRYCGGRMMVGEEVVVLGRRSGCWT